MSEDNLCYNCFIWAYCKRTSEERGHKIEQRTSECKELREKNRRPYVDISD